MAPDDGSERTDGGRYELDETVDLEGDQNFKYHVWDLDIDPGSDETYTLYVISRDGISVRSYLLPEEEVEHFEEGQVVWSKHRSTMGERLTEEIEIDEDEDDPFPQSTDYALAVATDRAGDRTPTVSVKFRHERDSGTGFPAG